MTRFVQSYDPRLSVWRQVHLLAPQNPSHPNHLLAPPGPLVSARVSGTRGRVGAEAGGDTGKQGGGNGAGWGKWGKLRGQSLWPF